MELRRAVSAEGNPEARLFLWSQAAPELALLDVCDLVGSSAMEVPTPSPSVVPHWTSSCSGSQYDSMCSTYTRAPRRVATGSDKKSGRAARGLAYVAVCCVSVVILESVLSADFAQMWREATRRRSRASSTGLDMWSAHVCSSRGMRGYHSCGFKSMWSHSW